jgi:membrane protein DedA with SNARE-associated domain
MSAPSRQARHARSVNITCAAFIPVLLTSRPVVLELLNGSLLAVAAGGAFVHSDHASLWAALTAPLAVWLPVDAVSWWAGRRFGVGVVRWLTVRNLTRARIVARAERVVDKFGVLAVVVGPVLPLPTVVIFAATGWRRMPLVLFLLLDAAGVAARGSVALAVGYSYGDHGIGIARRFSQYSAWVAGIFIVAICIIIVIRTKYVMKERRRGYRHDDTNAEDD